MKGADQESPHYNPECAHFLQVVASVVDIEFVYIVKYPNQPNKANQQKAKNTWLLGPRPLVLAGLKIMSTFITCMIK